jgi:3-oxoacyl-[acyl-carrier protein] reductase
MDLGIQGRTALVAASSKGLGRESARSLAREGVRVILCARGEEALRRTADEIRSESDVEVLDFAADLTKPDEVRRLVERSVERFGTVDILVNNCGGPPIGTFLEHDLDAWRRAVDTTLMSTIVLTREVLPFMIKKRWGRIVNITSMSVKQPVPGLILSNSLRAAVVGWAKTLADEVAHDRVLVNSICQGYFMTDRIVSLAGTRAKNEGKTPDVVLAEFTADVPLERMGAPEEFGPLVAFLASERASYITGATFAIDGGRCRGLL